MAMSPASALTFGVLGGMRHFYPESLAQGLWNLSPAEYALLGFACGLAFMLAELPNSFLKRQFDVLPGGLPSQPWLRPFCFLLDRVDSTLGVLLVVSLVLPVSVWTWIWALVLGPSSHALFSHWLHVVGEKARSL
jgi:CDP-2,3-bis-(O-geranylgeranyl)-sn-glycerol synthase